MGFIESDSQVRRVLEITSNGSIPRARDIDNKKDVLWNVDHVVEDNGDGLSLEGRTACNNRQWLRKLS
jgi:hypothetical protein